MIRCLFTYEASNASWHLLALCIRVTFFYDSPSCSSFLETVNSYSYDLKLKKKKKINLHCLFMAIWTEPLVATRLEK